MDKAKAEALTQILCGTHIGGWTIVNYVNHGKSAAVFSAKKAGQLAAIKVFDTELIERYGDKAQLTRIQREIELVGFYQENLVGIYGGGYDESRNIYYIIMEFVDGINLKEFLPKLKIEQIPTLTKQLASAALALENKGLVHRDIKPENIAICESGKRLVLLDFGVIRPIKGSDLTDPEGLRAFIGTLQYSSPEFLLRKETQDLDGYRSLTFYQIGAVLHDMIMGRPIFEKFSDPYAVLVNAVQFEKPHLFNAAIDPYWSSLADRCLLKNPNTRLKVVKWEDFQGPTSSEIGSPKERVAEQMATIRAKLDDPSTPPSSAPTFGVSMARDLISAVKVAAKTARSAVQGLPRLKTTGSEGGHAAVKLVFENDETRGFPYGLQVLLEIEILDDVEGVIACRGVAVLSNTPDTSASLVPWYEGVGESMMVLKAFEKFFFESVEWCIHSSPGLSGDFCVQYPDKVTE